MITQQVGAIHSVKATATGEPSLYSCQPSVDHIVDIHDVASYVLVEKRIIVKYRRASRNVSLPVAGVTFSGAA